jgi:hypothetical protein
VRVKEYAKQENSMKNKADYNTKLNLETFGGMVSYHILRPKAVPVMDKAPTTQTRKIKIAAWLCNRNTPHSAT